MIFVLWNHQEVFDGKSSFEMYLYPIFLACSFNAFTEPLIIWNHHIYILLVDVILLVVIVVACISVGTVASHFDSIQGPCGVFASF